MNIDAILYERSIPKEDMEGFEGLPSLPHPSRPTKPSSLGPTPFPDGQNTENAFLQSFSEFCSRVWDTLPPMQVRTLEIKTSNLEEGDVYVLEKWARWNGITITKRPRYGTLKVHLCRNPIDQEGYPIPLTDDDNQLRDVPTCDIRCKGSPAPAIGDSNAE